MGFQGIGRLFERVFDCLTERLIGQMRDTVMRSTDDACVSPVAG